MVQKFCTTSGKCILGSSVTGCQFTIPWGLIATPRRVMVWYTIIYLKPFSTNEKKSPTSQLTPDFWSKYGQLFNHFAWWRPDMLGRRLSLGSHRIHVWYLTYISLIFMVNVGKYTIHGSCGVVYRCTNLAKTSAKECLNSPLKRLHGDWWCYVQDWSLLVLNGVIHKPL